LSRVVGTRRGAVSALARVAGALLLLWGARPQPSAAGLPSATLRETVLLRIPVSADPAAISNLECTAGQPRCAAGLGFLSPNDTLYFYDFAHDNLKVIAIRPGARLVRLLPGLGAARGTRASPVAGVADSDGSLRLLVPAARRSEPPTLWILEAGTARWRQAPEADARAADARLFPPPRAEVGAPAGVTLGRDAGGNRFVERHESWHTQVLAKYGTDGRLVAQTILPERPTWKRLAGWTDKWVTSRGEVLEIHVGPRWMVVSAWTAGA